MVATGVGGVLSFLRDEENGLVVPRGDVSALAEGIGRLLTDRELARQLGAGGLQGGARALPAQRHGRAHGRRLRGRIVLRTPKLAPRTTGSGGSPGLAG